MKIKGYTKEEIENRLREEEGRIDIIRDFLRANAGVLYSADAIAEETGIKCVNNLLFFRPYDYGAAVGIKRKAVIDDDLDLCSTVQFYYVNKKLRLWKRKGEKEK